MHGPTYHPKDLGGNTFTALNRQMRLFTRVSVRPSVKLIVQSLLVARAALSAVAGESALPASVRRPASPTTVHTR